ncbi:HxlR family transcriptional regulator [Streptomyces sp. KS 21]|nr:HxlR family transcriptional regulator [Streptomyces sp. KS 21]
MDAVRRDAVQVGCGGDGHDGSSLLRRRMPGVSQKMLSVTLRSLTRDGLVARRVEPTVPPRVFYRLTGLGLSLEAALEGLRTWAEEHMVEIDRANEAAAQEADEG